MGKSSSITWNKHVSASQIQKRDWATPVIVGLVPVAVIVFGLFLVH